MTANPAAVKFPEAPLSANQAQPKKRTARLSDEEKQARAEARRIEREAAKLVRAQERAAAKERAYQEKIAALEGGDVQLPAVVLRDGTVFSVNYADIQALLTPYLGGLCLDVETTGYQLGHRHYALRTIQLGGEGLAVVLDADDQVSLTAAQWALHAATRLHAFSASADIVPVVHAGLIEWDEAWAKMVDGVQLAKLTDPAMAKSKSEGLKALSLALHGTYAVSPGADEARKALFAGIKCLTETNVTTPVERSGWAQVKKSCKTMTVYAGSDVLDLAATVRVLYERLPVSPEVLDRECQVAAMVAPAAYKGFPLDLAHIQLKIAEYEKSQADSKALVAEMTGGAITNPSSSKDQVLPYLLARGYILKADRKTKELSAGKPSLEPYANRGDELCRNIIEYRHCTTTLGLLLRPLENLCIEGDAVMRPTVYTLEAKTGRMSCVRPNGQQFSRQGGIRACVRCAPGYLGISADFSGCEILVAAALSGDRDLYEAETGPRCHRCGEFAYEDEGQWCACGFTVKDGRQVSNAHKGLHWLTAHTAFGEAATKENRYQAKRGCVPVQGSEILTRRGWLSHEQVRPGDETPALQPDGSMRWAKVLLVAHYSDAPLVRLSVGKNWTATVTPDHRWATRKRRDGGSRGKYFEDGITHAHDLTAEHVIKLGGAGVEGEGLSVSDAEAALIAWVYADGHLEQSAFSGRTSQGTDGRRRAIRAKVIQAKPKGIAALEECLAGTGAVYTKVSRGRAKPHHLETWVYEPPAAYVRDLWTRAGLAVVADKHAEGFSLIEFVLALTSSQRRAFLQAMEAAEGFRDRNGTLHIGQNAGPVLDAIELAGYLEGFYVKRYKGATYKDNQFWEVTMTKPRVGCTRLNRETAGRSDVWCVQTETGTWTMRQHGGPAMITGNTFTRLFGGGPPTAADQVGCDVETMQQLFTAFNQVAPAFTAWDQWLRQCYKNGTRVWRDYATGKNWVQDIEGHNRMTYVTYSGRNVYITNGEHAAGNGAIQGTARELLVDGLLQWKYSQWGGVPVLPVHDQLIAVVKEDEAKAATLELARCMTTSVLSSPGFEVRVGVDVDEPFVSWQDSS